MPVELTAEEKARLRDIDAFNASIAAEGWQLRDRFLREDLSRIRLPNSTFEAVHVINVAWKDAQISNTRFSGCEFTLCDFAGATITNAVFEDCVFRNVSFSRATLDGCRFLRCRAEIIKARDAVFNHCAFEHWDDISGVYGGAALRETAFSQSKFDNTSLQVAELTRVQMKACQLRSVIFGQLTGSNLIFEASSLHHCGFVDTTYGNIAFDRCAFRAVTFDHFALEKALFRNAPAIQSLTILNSRWKQSLFTDCPAITELTIDSAQLQNWSLLRCQIAYLNLRDARIAGGAITECQIGVANFAGSALAGLRIERTGLLESVVLENASFEALTLADVAYASELQFLAAGVRYGATSARFPGTGE